MLEWSDPPSRPSTPTTATDNVARRARWPIGRILILGTLLLGLAWLIVTKSYVTYLAPRDPERALAVNSNDAVALVLKAERALTAALTPKPSPPETQSGAAESPAEPGLNLGRGLAQLRRALRENLAPPEPLPAVPPQLLQEVETSARRALVQDPLNARAVILLGYVADLRGDKPRAASLMTHAAKLSLHASAAQIWLLDYHLRTGDVEAAVRYADNLMRTRPTAHPVVIPILARLAEQPASAKAVQSLLATDPPWRGRFFAALSKHVSDQRTPLSLLIALRDSGQQPTPAEIKSYLDFLIGAKSFNLAYYVWLQFLPPEQLGKVGLIFDGGFDLPRSPLPFDWTLRAGSGATVELAPDEDDPSNNNLRLEFTGTRADRLQVQQRLMLEPGSYRLTYRYRGEISGRRGMIWLVDCAMGKQQRLKETAMFIGLQRGWREETVDFTVPEAGCESQFLRLIHHARSPSEQIVSGTTWYDDLKIARQ